MKPKRDKQGFIKTKLVPTTVTFTTKDGQAFKIPAKKCVIVYEEKQAKKDQ